MGEKEMVLDGLSLEEFLFRGMTSEYGKEHWVFGNLFRYGGSWCIAERKLSVNRFNEIIDSDYEEVYGDSVSLYTGVKDVDDVRVFGKDIVDFTVFDYNDADTQYRGVVKFVEGAWMICRSDVEEYSDNWAFNLFCVKAQDDEMRVVGNLTENPEMVEVEHA